MSNLKEIKDIPIFMYVENNNGYIIDESEVKNFDKFKNVPIINHININDEEIEEKVVGVVMSATRLEFPYVYGDVTVFDDLNFMKFKNYQIQCTGFNSEEIKLTNVDILAIELE